MVPTIVMVGGVFPWLGLLLAVALAAVAGRVAARHSP